MRYTKTYHTYDPQDCVSTGWHIQSNRTHAALTYRSRWQGTRSGMRYVARIDGGPLTDAQAGELAQELTDLLHCGELDCRLGSAHGIFRCVGTGYVVR